MASLGSLVVSLAIDTARFQGDLGRAAQLAESRMRNIKDTSTKALAAITVAATAAGGALVYALKGAIDRADNMSDLAQSAGVTVEQLSRLAYAGKNSGVEIELIGKALAKLADSGVPDANAALIDLAGEFAAMPDGAAKTARAIEVFGLRIGPALIPLLNNGRDGLKAFADQSDRLGSTLSTSAAEAADQFNGSLGALAAAGNGFTNLLAAEMLPALNAVSQALVETAEKGQAAQSFIYSVSYAFKLLIELGANVALSFGSIGSALAALAASAGAVAHGEFAMAKSILMEANADQIAAEIRTNELIARLWDERVDTAKKGASILDNISLFHLGKKDEKKQKEPNLSEVLIYSKPAFDMAAQQADALKQLNETALRNNQEFMIEISNDTNETLVNIGEHFAKLAEDAKNASSELTVFAEQAARNMQDSLAQFLFDPFKDGLRGMLSGFVNTLRQMAAQAAASLILRQLFGWAAGATSGGASSFFGSMAKGVGGKAAGGPVYAGTPYMVGERGPELFMPGASGSIIPNHAMGGISITVAPVYNMDNRGATQELIKILPAIMERNKRETVAAAVAAVRDNVKRRGRV